MALLQGNHNIEIYQGSDFSYNVTIKDETTGIPINLTGATFNGRIKEYPGDSVSHLFTFVPTNLGLGNFKIQMSNTITSGIAFVKGVYEVDIHYSNGTIDTILYGNVVVRTQV